ncbi:MAG: hypothetical protein LBT05_04865 [Planctomycetaceae bacterium]|jgi:hypothetical protein|nr:hypothetical protein [Planctomycetaceae bacterium]
MKTNDCCCGNRAYCRSCCEHCFIDEPEKPKEHVSSMGVGRRWSVFYTTFKNRTFILVPQIVRFILCLRN